jgi:hypothetical protein
VATESGTDQGRDTGQNALTLGLAMIAGLGLTLMVVAAGYGVIGGENADDGAMALLFASGVVLFVAGVGAWLGVFRPWERFDDINQPHYFGDHHTEEYGEQEPGEVHVEEPVPPHST